MAKHKHRFMWYMNNSRLDIDNPKRQKVIRCVICNKSLDDIIEKLEKRK